jgi:hypothetical protein
MESRHKYIDDCSIKINKLRKKKDEITKEKDNIENSIQFIRNMKFVSHLSRENLSNMEMKDFYEFQNK